MIYSEIRNELIEVNARIFKQEKNDGKYILNCAKILGLKCIGNKISFSNKSEQEPYWDFMTYERIDNAESLRERYLKLDMGKDGDIQFLNSINVYETALYRLDNSSGSHFEVEDIETGIVHKIIDSGLSSTKLSSGLIFFRMLEIENIKMTSGFSFIFFDEMDTVIKRYKRMKINEYTINDSITRFRVMMKLNRIYGINI